MRSPHTPDHTHNLTTPHNHIPHPPPADLIDLYKQSDAGATAALMGKLSVERSYSAKLDDVRTCECGGGGGGGGVCQSSTAVQLQLWKADRFQLWNGLHAFAAHLLRASSDRPSCLPAVAPSLPAALQQRLVATLREYRMLHMRGAGPGMGTNLSPNSLVLPERLKGLPLLTLGGAPRAGRPAAMPALVCEVTRG